MTDNRPDLNTTEVRQGNSKKTNARALVFGLIAVAIVFAIAIWYFTVNQQDTATTTGGGTTLEDVSPAPDEVGSDLDDLSTPAPVIEPEPTPAAPAVGTPPADAQAVDAAPEDATETPTP